MVHELFYELVTGLSELLKASGNKWVTIGDLVKSIDIALEFHEPLSNGEKIPVRVER